MAWFDSNENVDWNNIFQDICQPSANNSPLSFEEVCKGINKDFELANQRNQQNLQRLQQPCPMTPTLDQFQSPQNHTMDTRCPVLYQHKPLMAPRHDMCPHHNNQAQHEERSKTLSIQKRKQAQLEENRKLKQQLLELIQKEEQLEQQVQRYKRQQEEQHPQQSDGCKKRKLDTNESSKNRSRNSKRSQAKRQQKQKSRRKVAQKKRYSKSNVKAEEPTIIQFPRNPRQPINEDNPAISLLKQGEKYYFYDKSVRNVLVDKVLECPNVNQMLISGEFNDLVEEHKIELYLENQDDFAYPVDFTNNGIKEGISKENSNRSSISTISAVDDDINMNSDHDSNNESETSTITNTNSVMNTSYSTNTDNNNNEIIELNETLNNYLASDNDNNEIMGLDETIKNYLADHNNSNEIINLAETINNYLASDNNDNQSPRDNNLQTPYNQTIISYNSNDNFSDISLCDISAYTISNINISNLDDNGVANNNSSSSSGDVSGNDSNMVIANNNSCSSYISGNSSNMAIASNSSNTDEESFTKDAGDLIGDDNDFIINNEYDEDNDTENFREILSEFLG